MCSVLVTNILHMNDQTENINNMYCFSLFNILSIYSEIFLHVYNVSWSYLPSLHPLIIIFHKSDSQHGVLSCKLFHNSLNPIISAHISMDMGLFAGA